jgi:hypothetical protein
MNVVTYVGIAPAIIVISERSIHTPKAVRSVWCDRPLAYRASRPLWSALLSRFPASGRWPNAGMICGSIEALAKTSPTPHTPGQCHTLHA